MLLHYCGAMLQQLIGLSAKWTIKKRLHRQDAALFYQ